MTRSSISGRSAPSTDRAVVSKPSSPRSTRLITVRAVSPFEPLAIAELRVDRRRDAETAVRQAVRPLHGGAAVEVDPDHTRQAHVGGDLVDQIDQPVAVVAGASHASQAHTPRCDGSPEYADQACRATEDGTVGTFDGVGAT